jgi:hypothetical protein
LSKHFYYVPETLSYLHKSRRIVVWEDCHGQSWFYVGETELTGLTYQYRQVAARNRTKSGPFKTIDAAMSAAKSYAESGNLVRPRVGYDRVSERAREKVEA